MKNSKATTYDQLNDSILSMMSKMPFAYTQAEDFLSGQILFKQDSNFTSITQRQLDWARENAQKETIYKSSFLLGGYFFVASQFNKSKQFFEQSLLFAATNEEKALSYFLLSKVFIEKRLYLEALEYLRQSKIQVYHLGYEELEAEINLAEAYCYLYLSNFEAAKTRLATAETKLKDVNLQHLKTKHDAYEGLLEFKQDNFLPSMISLYKVLEHSKTDTASKSVALAYSLIGQIYLKQKNEDRAEYYFKQALSLHENKNYLKGEAEMALLLGKLYLQTHKYKEADLFLTASLNNFQKVGDAFGQCLSLNSLAEYYLLTKQHPLVLPTLWKANETDKLLADSYLYFITNLQLSKYYLAFQKNDSALFYAKKAIGYSKTINDQNEVLLAYRNLSDVCYALGDYKQSTDALVAANQMADIQQYLTNSVELKLLQFDLEKMKQETVIHSLTKERNEQNKVLLSNKMLLEKQKSIIVFIGIILLLISLLTFGLLTLIYQKRRHQRKLEIRNNQIAQQKEEIEVQQQYLMEINRELEKLSIVARETDNGIKVMNEVGRILWVNEGYVKMHGYTLDDLQRIENIDLVGDHANIDIRELVSVWYGDKKPITYEALNKTKWGQEIWVQTTLTPILDANGRIDRMIAIESDITRIKEAENEIISKNHDITSSIYYAKRIQEAMMTPFNTLTKHFPDSFCFHLPKSIVSGDFYWITYRFDRLIVACADSTGHGVPGAFMSLIGISFLNKIVNEKGFVSPSIILNRLRMNIIDHLHQSEGEHIASDGLDMSIISIDLKNNLLEYAGAMNPIMILRNADLIELKPDRMPVGFFDNEDRPFSSTNLNLQPNDQIFMYTDGYYDQFGGANGSKMKGLKFRNIIKECANKPSQAQKQIIENQFYQWKGNHTQVDDVLILGININ
ncbi:MAG TPA: hypothetical protein DCY97_15335 [Marinilabiliales bacterium]|nr:hypothetical protein [Marinilabiliales bacterium]